MIRRYVGISFNVAKSPVQKYKHLWNKVIFTILHHFCFINCFVLDYISCWLKWTTWELLGDKTGNSFKQMKDISKVLRVGKETITNLFQIMKMILPELNTSWRAHIHISNEIKELHFDCILECATWILKNELHINCTSMLWFLMERHPYL